MAIDLGLKTVAPNEITLSEELDSLHILPLSILPLKHSALKRKRLALNNRMEGVVKLYNGAETGGGQVYPQDLASVYDFNDEEVKDIAFVGKLARLPNYDVYSLRIQLRDHLRYLSRELAKCCRRSTRATLNSTKSTRAIFCVNRHK